MVLLLWARTPDTRLQGYTHLTCLLSAISYLLSSACCLLSVVCFLLFVVCCLLSAVCCVLSFSGLAVSVVSVRHEVARYVRKYLPFRAYFIWLEPNDVVERARSGNIHS